MSDMDDLINAVLSGSDVTRIGQEYRSRTRMIQVDPSIGQNDGGWTEWPRSKSQEAIHSVMMDRRVPDPSKSARVREAIDKASDKLAERPFPNWPTLPRGY